MTSGVGGGTSVSAVTLALRNAADIVARETAAPDGTLDVAQWTRLNNLVEGLLGAAPGGLPQDPGLQPRQRDVDALRRALLRSLAAEADNIDASELVGLLQAMEEAVPLNWHPEINEFTERLVGTHALEAVVEIAHDMRSPLSSILFLVDALQRSQKGRLTPVQERQLGLIYGAALGLNMLATDALDAVRGDTLVDGRPVPFSISETISSTCAIVRPIAEEKGLLLESHQPARDGRLGYPAALSRVLLNLVTNALKYTERGTVTIGCTERDGDVVEFWITDTGRGIPPSVLSMLFDGFRPWAGGVRFSSTGLGLAICRNLLTAMNSKLSVETEIEVGTRFSFLLDLPRA